MTILSGYQEQQYATVKETKLCALYFLPDAPTVSAPGWICDVVPTDIATAAKGYAKKCSGYDCDAQDRR
ncbi:hypothetical protein O9929_11305 [Vibrio lentus]|nr:hypothetical protein [Vibrio lentus]